MVQILGAHGKKQAFVNQVLPCNPLEGFGPRRVAEALADGEFSHRSPTAKQISIRKRSAVLRIRVRSSHTSSKKSVVGLVWFLLGALNLPPTPWHRDLGNFIAQGIVVASGCCASLVLGM